MDFDPTQENQDDGEGWLVSYADMMTLIACFFILMMAFANYDPVGFNDKAGQVSQAFLNEKLKKTKFKMKLIQEEMAKHNEKEERKKITLRDADLIASFSSSVIFANLESEVKGRALETIDSMIDIIHDNSPTARVLIEGHADDFFKGEDLSLALSAKRSVFVAQRFYMHGFPKENISVIAKGDSEPLKKSRDVSGERDPQKASLNRRVVIRVLEPKDKKKVKLGFGIYFRESKGENSEDYTAPIEDQFEVDTKPEGLKDE